MSEEKMKIDLYEELAKYGYQCKIISSDHIHDLQSEIERQYRQGLFDEEFYTEELTGFDFKIADSFVGSTSLVIVAAPQPQVRVHLQLAGRIISRHHTSDLQLRDR